MKEKLRDIASRTTLLTAAPGPALPSPRELMAQTVLLSPCMESRVAQKNRENTEHITGHRQECDDYLSVLLQEYGSLCMFSLFNQFSYKKRWSSAFQKQLHFVPQNYKAEENPTQ